jgi:hypothetical protein
MVRAAGEGPHMLQKSFAAVVGAVVAVAVVMAWQALTHMIDPPPTGMNWNDAAAVTAFMRAMPAWKFAVIVLGYGLAAFAGGWIASLVAKGRGWHAWVPAGLLLVGTFLNISTLWHPTWFPAACILTILAGAWLSGRVTTKKA